MDLDLLPVDASSQDRVHSPSEVFIEASNGLEGIDCLLPMRVGVERAVPEATFTRTLHGGNVHALLHDVVVASVIGCGTAARYDGLDLVDHPGNSGGGFIGFERVTVVFEQPPAT